MQFIHVKVYGASHAYKYIGLLADIITDFSGESEYWFAMIKVLMIIFFIIVGLIFDWGGVKGHPGPVSLSFHPVVTSSFH